MRVEERFLRYVAVNTQSAAGREQIPSTECQWDLARLLAEELRSLGVEDARVDGHCYVMGTLPSNLPEGGEGVALGLIAHMDTATETSGAGVRPRIVKDYDGGTIVLNEALGMTMGPDVYESLNKHLGEDLIVTDGTTLLGADNKAGVAEIMTLVEYLQTHPEVPHGKLCIGFTPDEEVGHGANAFDIAAFGAALAYTVDGGELGELEYENFNAASAKIDIQGRNVHPGYAKDKMINAIEVACDLQRFLPACQRPEHTEGYEGFYHCVGLNGTVEKASVSYIIRDHDADKFEQKKVFMWACVDLLKKKYGDEVLTLTVKDQYFNMRKMVEPHPQVIDKALEAMERAGVKPLVRPIRGGTDGARLSFMGLPCPNLFTGGMNFHGKFEYCSLTTMRKAQQVILNLAQLWAE